MSSRTNSRSMSQSSHAWGSGLLWNVGYPAWLPVTCPEKQVMISNPTRSGFESSSLSWPYPNSLEVGAVVLFLPYFSITRHLSMNVARINSRFRRSFKFGETFRNGWRVWQEGRRFARDRPGIRSDEIGAGVTAVRSAEFRSRLFFFHLILLRRIMKTRLRSS